MMQSSRLALNSSLAAEKTGGRAAAGWKSRKLVSVRSFWTSARWRTGQKTTAAASETFGPQTRPEGDGRKLSKGRKGEGLLDFDNTQDDRARVAGEY